MRSQNPIADYAAVLSRELAFDGPLSRRVRKEVEDHLWESAASEPDQNSLAAQRCAIARFGDARAIAVQYAAGSLYRQTKNVGVIAILAIAGIYLAMLGRVEWYGLLRWTISDHLRTAFDVARPFIRINFMAAVALGMASWAYSASRKTPSALDRARCRQLRVSQFLSAAATAVASLSVISDLVVTAARLTESPWSMRALVPLGLVAAEIGMAIGLAVHLLITVRRTSLAAALLDDADVARLA
jgi:hypothetical protein